MMDALFALLEKDPAWKSLDTALKEGRGPAAVFSCPEGCRLPLWGSMSRGKTGLIVTDTEAAALELYRQEKTYREDVQLFLCREMPLVHVQAASAQRRSMRLSVLSRLCLGMPSLIITHAGALMERLAPPEAFFSCLRSLRRGEEIPPRTLLKFLVDSGYERVDMLEGPGQCALRGDILDVFPPQREHPCRIEFYGDEIDQLRIFDESTQRSMEQTDSILLPPAFETPQTPALMKKALKALGEAAGFESQRESWEQGRPCLGADVLLPLLYKEACCLFDYLPKDALLFLTEPGRIADEGKAFSLSCMESVAGLLERGEGHPCQKELLLPPGELEKRLSTPRTAVFYSLFRTSPLFQHPFSLKFEGENAPAYLGDMGELKRELKQGQNKGETRLLFAGEGAAFLFRELEEEGLSCRMESTLSNVPAQGTLLVLKTTLPRGFRLPGSRLTVLSQEELFGKQQTHRKQKKSGLKFSDLTVGDYVVHEAHGIGRFVGVEQLTVQNSTRDYLLLVYKGGDKLYIPTDQLDRIQKYMGAGEEGTPNLSKLGGGEWQQKVSKARTAAKKLAFDLAELYAKRTSVRGFAFSPDTPWQKKLESAFPYEETPDQLQCIAEIKKDMESPRPMDRLLCGDVGYGKTEVALRAAFKAVQDGKQVAFLVPTTILAQQHFATLSGRFEEFPVHLGCLSRFQTPKEREEVKRRLAKGEIDMVVGTHALLAKDVKFKDLGLLIIDEEHRFGVNHKEQLKALRSQVDVLTMTATPIPRTLNMAMTGIRDVSTIETPPENRFPVETYVMEFSPALIASAIRRELSRGGQVFVISNRVMGMENTLSRLRELVPECSMAMAHGQMHEQLLEKTMIAFINREYDLLLCSTIVESGVDVPNCNTLIVLEADKLGLAQLYQLRGRVGRSSRLAYAYFTVNAGQAVSETAQKRLLAIREFTQFGAGFRLAMRDLEIRGAGSLLGAEQHGHITDIGYEYYCKLIRSAVEEARGNAPAPDIECTVDAPVDAFVPKSFVGNELLRMGMYKRIAEITGEEEYGELYEEFTDRFGTLPESVETLMRLSLIKALGARAGLCAVRIQSGLAQLKFDPSASPDGGRLLLWLGGIQGARLVSGETPQVQIRIKDWTAAEFVKKMPQFLTGLIRCKGPEDRV